MKTGKKKFRIPIALHFYCAIIVVTILSLLITGFSIQLIIQSYIAKECNQRIISCWNSCQNFAVAFRDSVSENSGATPEETREYLLKSIVSSTDLSNDASIMLLCDDPYEDSEYTIIWPTASSSSVSTLRSSYNVLDSILEEDGLEVSAETATADYDGNTVYYRFVNVEYSTREDYESLDQDKYYLLIYVNSARYISFSNAMNIAVLRAIIFSVITAAFISIIVAFPLFFSTRKLSKFAQQIGKGVFTPLKGRLVSRELSDLGDLMNKMALRLEKTDIEQKTFFQNASHELRTPLMSIQGYAEGIKYGVFDDEKQEEAVDVIISETTRLSNLVENLLTVSKMDMSKSGSYTVKKQILDVVELSDVAIDKVRGGFLHSGKELITSMDARGCYIYGNENDIFRMLENIFSNCLRYAATRVEFSVRKESNKNVVFTIKDDGKGISEEVLAHLFERFAKGSEGKHGIGLALAKSIAEEHNGSIRAYNNNGACFEIILPLTDTKSQMTKINNGK